MPTETLAILAGGEGSRMGCPKGHIRIDGRPILAVLLERLSWDGPTLLVTAPGREHPPAWEALDREVVDPVPGQGPLRGILTALEHTSTPTTLLLTVDMPAVRSAQLRFLLEQLTQRPQGLGVFLTRTLASQKRVEPFPCVLRREARTIIAQRLTKKRRAVQSLAREERFITVDAPDWPAETWTNLNHPDDLQRYGAHLALAAPKE